MTENRITLIRLPWPGRELWPNGSRGHWAKHSTAKARYKQDCAYLIAGKRMELRLNQGRHVIVTFHKPDAGRFDLDNALAAIKSGLDALSEAWGVDDSEWTYTLLRGRPVKGGCVLVEVSSERVEVPILGEID